MAASPVTLWFFCGMLIALAAGSLLGMVLTRVCRNSPRASLVAVFTARVRGWWAMTLVLLLAMLTGGLGSIIVFGCPSFLLLREFITIPPTRRGDHHALFWVFLIIPLQYALLAGNWYGLFIILIPVFAFLLIPARMAAAGETQNFLERAAKIQWGLMLCVYAVSHAPALIKLPLPGAPGAGLRLLVFLVTVIQVADLVRRLVDGVIGHHPVARTVDETMCWEGVLAGWVAAIALGAALWWVTPFTPGQAALMTLAGVVMGSFGELCYGAIRRDRNRKGIVVVTTRASALERAIALCFAAPIFFHLTRYFFVASPLSLF